MYIINIIYTCSALNSHSAAARDNRGRRGGAPILLRGKKEEQKRSGTNCALHVKYVFNPCPGVEVVSLLCSRQKLLD